MNGIPYCQATGNACIHLSSTAKQDSWEQKLHLKRPALPHSTCVISWTAWSDLHHPVSKQLLKCLPTVMSALKVFNID